MNEAETIAAFNDFARTANTRIEAATAAAAAIEQKNADLHAQMGQLEQHVAERLNGRIDSYSSAEQAPTAVVAQVVTESKSLESLRSGETKAIRLSVKQFFPLHTKGTVTSVDVPDPTGRDPEIYGSLPRPIAVRDLLVQRPTVLAGIEYLRATRTGGAAIQVVEGDAKSEIDINSELKMAKVQTIAAWIAASRQVLDDNAQLTDFIAFELADALRLSEDAQLLKGNGMGSNIAGMWTLATAYSRAKAGDTAHDALRRAITQVQLSRGAASGIIVSPVGLETLELAKDLDGRYMVDLDVTDNNGRAVTWRLPVVVTDALGEAEFMVGDFVRAARLYDRQQASLEISLSHADFFTRNLVAILAEERIALTVPRPDLLIKGTFESLA